MHKFESLLGNEIMKYCIFFSSQTGIHSTKFFLQNIFYEYYYFPSSSKLYFNELLYSDLLHYVIFFIALIFLHDSEFDEYYRLIKLDLAILSDYKCVSK